jgi:hypothetical protein
LAFEKVTDVASSSDFSDTFQIQNGEKCHGSREWFGRLYPELIEDFQLMWAGWENPSAIEM